MRRIRTLMLVLLAMTATGAHATLAYLPLASADSSTAEGVRFDGIDVVELPTIRSVRTLAIAPAQEIISVNPDGSTLAVRETAPSPESFAVYDAQSGALRHRWSLTGCAAELGEVDWHPLRPEVLIIAGACFFNLETGAIEETPQTLGVISTFNRRLVTTSDRGNYLVVAQGTPPGGGGATVVRVIDLRDPRNGRDYPGLNGWGVIGFGETTLLSQRTNGMRYTDLASGADLGPVPMPTGWIPQPLYRAMADGTIIATGLAGPGVRQRLVRLRDRTTPGEFIAELPPFAGPPIYFEIGREYAVFSNWLRPSCGPFSPPCVAGPMTITSIELASGRSFIRTYPTQALAAEGPLLAAGAAPSAPVPTLRAPSLLALSFLFLLVLQWRRTKGRR